MVHLKIVAEVKDQMFVIEKYFAGDNWEVEAGKWSKEAGWAFWLVEYGHNSTENHMKRMAMIIYLKTSKSNKIKR